ncbi:MAG: holo-ACP synthase [Proteobacteria bacterium]|nr:holo-ACP synthase [Pseudomonadota bacterium]
MVIGLGVDIVKIERIRSMLDRYGERFLRKVFREEEIKRKDVMEIGGKFAVKEAFVKALGTGFSKNVFFKDISVLNDDVGKPFVQLSDKIIKQFELENIKIHVSISHDGEYAIAMAVLERL